MISPTSRRLARRLRGPRLRCPAGIHSTPGRGGLERPNRAAAAAGMGVTPRGGKVANRIPLRASASSL